MRHQTEYERFATYIHSHDGCQLLSMSDDGNILEVESPVSVRGTVASCIEFVPATMADVREWLGY